MITHRIIKEKSRVQLPRAFNGNPNWPRPELQQQRIDFHPNRRFKNREDFENWYHNLPFSVGSIVTLAVDPIQYINQCHLVVEACGDFDKVEWHTHSGWPKVYKFVQIHPEGPAMIKDWIRWDSTNGYRELAKTEFEGTVLQNRDLIQNYHKAYIRQPESANDG